MGPFWSCFFFHWGRFGRGRFGLRGPFSTFIGAVLAMGRFGRFPLVRPTERLEFLRNIFAAYIVLFIIIIIIIIKQILLKCHK